MLGNKTRIVLTKTKDKFFHLQIFVSSVTSTLRFPKPSDFISTSDLSVRPASIVCQRTPIPMTRIYARLFCNKDNFCTCKMLLVTKNLPNYTTFSLEQKRHLLFRTKITPPLHAAKS